MEFKSLFIPLLSGALGGLIFMLMHNHLYQKTLAVIRMDEIISGHVKEFGEKEIDSQEMDQLSRKYSQALEKALIRIAEREKVTLLVAPAVVSKLPDYTLRLKNEIRAQLDEE